MVATGLAETFRAQAPAVFTVALGAALGAVGAEAATEGPAEEDEAAATGVPAVASSSAGVEQAPTAKTATIAVVTAIRRRLSMSFSSIVLSFS
ncbi:hypothetical protein Aca07nite_77930 [Actinoplanes capillaceus]|uniref:Secreted protein n=1 Tax=Actinoplanes campanulatus TaxID=113559 RepID=A0ABQ3WW48_9ACTN|nr:hypothetical protein Aca07nite_77930 [Actinoplanes capillaceus]